MSCNAPLNTHGCLRANECTDNKETSLFPISLVFFLSLPLSFSFSFSISSIPLSPSHQKIAESLLHSPPGGILSVCSGFITSVSRPVSPRISSAHPARPSGPTHLPTISSPGDLSLNSADGRKKTHSKHRCGGGGGREVVLMGSNLEAGK